MEWSPKRIQIFALLIVGGASAFVVCYELALKDEGLIPEFSNTTAIAVEIAVGLSIAVIVYGLTKIDQKEIDCEIEKIRNATDKLEKLNYEIKRKEIIRNYDNLILLLSHNKGIEKIYCKIKKDYGKDPSSLEPYKPELRGVYTLYIKTIDYTPLLHTDRDVIMTTLWIDNINAYFSKDWESLLKNLEDVISVKSKLEGYALKEKTKLNELEKEYER